MTTGACDTFTRSSIYRYAQRKFVLFQEVATTSAVQWQAVQVEDTVLLAVAQLVEGVKLFQYDGWRFVAAPVQHYEGRFGPGVTGLAASQWNGTYVFGERQDRTMGRRDTDCVAGGDESEERIKGKEVKEVVNLNATKYLHLRSHFELQDCTLAFENYTRIGMKDS